MEAIEVKKFLSALTVLFAVAIFLPAMTYAELDYRSVPVTYLKEIIGNWYDTKGNLVLTISNDYKLNGCSIVSVGFTADTTAFYKVRIAERSGYRDIEFLNTGSERNSYHEVLVLNYEGNNPLVLRRTKEPRYVESIGGIYLGMDKNQVASLYGQPSNATARYQSNTWTYNNEGFEVGFYYGAVTAVTIFKNGNRRFDWSGLSANSSRADFEYKYNSRVNQRGNLNLGHGELINIESDRVSLRVFTSGYRF